jgi:hypothetical protein
MKLDRMIAKVVVLVFILSGINANESSNVHNLLADTEPHSKIMVHYMPWFATKAFSAAIPRPEYPSTGHWWHWEMENFNPDIVDNTGKRQIATHYYPLIGLYDSFDPDVMEYHVLLMKLAGIDGMIVDWYGIENHSDYGLLHRNTGLCFEYTRKANLEFAVCYGDATFHKMVGDIFSEDEALAHAREVMLFLQDNWFPSDHYLKSNERPVLLNFGPAYFYDSAQWDSIFTVLDPKPYYFPLHEYMVQASVATGYFPWVILGSQEFGGPTQTEVDDYLDDFYQAASAWKYVVGGTFPGFWDIYGEAGGESYGYLDTRDGQTFFRSLKKSLEYNPDVIQIITWNDFGEGTTIEPALEYGYEYLEAIQDLRRQFIDTTFVFTGDDLEIPKQLYDLRKSYSTNVSALEILDSVFTLIITGDLAVACDMMQNLSTDKHSSDVRTPIQYRLSQNFPNPFNPTTTIQYDIPKTSHVILSISNMNGQLVARLVNQKQQPGHYSVNWDACNVSSGVYFYQIRTDDFHQVKKCILMK